MDRVPELGQTAERALHLKVRPDVKRAEEWANVNIVKQRGKLTEIYLTNGRDIPVI